MKTRIEGYRNFPGKHCGSVAMRSLLHHYCGLALEEDVVFGLGAGVDCLLLSLPGMRPSCVVFGRTPTMEVDLAAALGVDYAERRDPDDARAWRDVRAEVLAGRPTMLSGDIFYLDYREFKVHFPAHRFVLVGFDDERQVACIADRIRAEPELCSYPALFASRNPPEGLSTCNLWGRFADGHVAHDLVLASRTAIATCARRMLGEESALAGELSGAGAASSGVAAIRRLAAELPDWAGRADAAELAAYNAGCVEKFGNGGGNFRRMYAGFLSWARALDPDRVPRQAPELALRAADGWTALAERLRAAPEEPGAWREAARVTAAVADVEQELFEGLARAGRPRMV